jgi:hypothetical protein
MSVSDIMGLRNPWLTSFSFPQTASLPGFTAPPSADSPVSRMYGLRTAQHTAQDAAQHNTPHSEPHSEDDTRADASTRDLDGQNGVIEGKVAGWNLSLDYGPDDMNDGDGVAEAG